MIKAKIFDPDRDGDNPKLIAEYLTSALTSNDPTQVGQALNLVVRSQNVVALSEETGLAREGMYRKFGKEADPRLGSLRTLLKGLGVRLIVEPIPGAVVKRRPRRIISSYGRRVR